MSPKPLLSARASTSMFLSVGMLCFSSAPTLAQETVGNPLVDGAAGADTAPGAIFVELDGFSQAGQLSSFAFFNNDLSQNDRELTPLVLELVGSDFFIRGVGAAVTNTGSGAQTYPFALTEGSSAVGPNFFFGYKNGLDSDSNQPGVIEFSFVPGATSERFFGQNFANNLDPDVNLGQGTFLGAPIGQQERVYSVQATSVPEPASAGLLALGAFGMVALRRRKSA